MRKHRFFHVSELSHVCNPPGDRPGMTDVESVGGKNASLGEMISQLAASRRARAGRLRHHGACLPRVPAPRRLTERIAQRLDALDTDDVKALAACGAEIRGWVIEAPLPADLEARSASISRAYGRDSPRRSLRGALLGHRRGPARRVLRRPAGDLPERRGIDDVLEAHQATSSRRSTTTAPSPTACTRASRTPTWRCRPACSAWCAATGASGVMFTIDTESGFPTWSSSPAAYGLGETVVQGAVNPDEFYVHKPMLWPPASPDHPPPARLEAASRWSSTAARRHRPSVRTVDTPPERATAIR
jgi:pyruvate, water dikinase